MPTKSMTVEGQKTMIMVSIHAARGRVSLRVPTIAWCHESLVEEPVAPEEESLDSAATRRLFLSTQASETGRDVARAPNSGR